MAKQWMLILLTAPALWISVSTMGNPPNGLWSYLIALMVVCGFCIVYDITPMVIKRKDQEVTDLYEYKLNVIEKGRRHSFK